MPISGQTGIPLTHINDRLLYSEEVYDVFVCLSPQKAAETEDQQTDSQVVANPEQYIKHPLQNRWE